MFKELYARLEQAEKLLPAIKNEKVRVQIQKCVTTGKDMCQLSEGEEFPQAYIDTMKKGVEALLWNIDDQLKIESELFQSVKN